MRHALEFTNRRRGFTLIETGIAIMITALMLSFSTYLLFMVGRNIRNVHDQSLSQNNAASAGERAAMIMRQAQRYMMWPGDEDTNSTLSRIQILRPGAGGTTESSVLCFNPNQGRIEFYEDASDVSFSGTKTVTTSDGSEVVCHIPTEDSSPTRSWAGQTAFFVLYENRYRVTLHLEFAYSGFALRDAASNLQRGRFVTDVIAKNHYLDKDTESYDAETSASPALLY